MQFVRSDVRVFDSPVLELLFFRDLSNHTKKGGAMRIRRIPKGNGRFRTIYVPNAAEKRKLRALLPLLHELHAKLVDEHGTRGIAHGFVENRNPVTCALPHRGFQVTVSCDLENWFDTVSKQQLLDAGVPPEVAEQITVDGYVRQGLPTSPVAANIAAVAFDKDMAWSLSTLKLNMSRHGYECTCAYTRYADDITVSFSLAGIASEWPGPSITYIKNAITRNAKYHNWTIAEHKTHVQHAKAGRRIVVGIAVDDRVQATRKTRRKLRAARHQASKYRVDNGVNGRPTVSPTSAPANSARGLTEWAACKLPRRCRSTRQLMGAPLASGGSQRQSAQATTNNTAVVSGSGRRILIAKKPNC